MFGKIKSFFARTKDIGVFTSSASRGWGVLGQAVRNAGMWLKWFRISPRLKPVDKIANDIAAIDIIHVDKEGNRFDKSPAIELLYNPNNLPEFTKFQLIRLLEIHYKIVGEAFWIVERDNRGNPLEILPIPPHWVKSIPRKQSDGHYKVFTSDGQKYEVPKENMVYFKRIDAYEPFKRGVGDSQQIGDELQIDEAMAKFQNLTFKNGAIPPVVVGMKGSTKIERDKFKVNWKSEYGGLRNSHSIAVVNEDAISVQVLKQTMKDLDYVNSRKFIQDLTLEHYMIPKELIGKVENSNRATITQAQMIYEKNALKPDIILIQDVLNKQYLPMFQLEGKLEFEPYLTSDKEFDRTTAFDGWDKGLLTRNEARQKIGEDEAPGGNVYKSKLGEIFTAAKEETQAQIDIQPQREENFIDRPVYIVNDKKTHSGENKSLYRAKELSEEAQYTVWETFDKAAEAGEEEATRIIKRFMQRQQNDLTDLVMNYLESKKALPDDLEKDINDFFKDEDRTLKKELSKIWLASGELGFEAANELFDFGLSWNIVREEWAVMIEEFGLEEAKTINDTTKDALKKQIIEGLNQGESIPEIRDRVSGVYSIAKDSRATMIARTETHMATVGTTKATYAAAGIEKNSWLTTMDGNERDWHGSIHGQIKRMDEPFVTGLGNLLMFPGDPAGPAEDVIQCRCVLLPVFE